MLQKMCNPHRDAHWSGVIFGTALPLALGKEGGLYWKSPKAKQLLAGEFLCLSPVEKSFFPVLSLSHLF